MARRKQTTASWDIVVSLSYADPDEPHADITLEPNLSLDDAAARQYSHAEVAAAFRWVAGIVARVSIVLADKILESRSIHRCARYDPDYGTQGCSVRTGVDFKDFTVSAARDEIEDGMVDPARISSGYDVCFVVPYNDRGLWMARVQEVLADILATEAWQPSAEDERVWRGDHVTPPIRHELPTVPAAPTRESAK